MHIGSAGDAFVDRGDKAARAAGVKEEGGQWDDEGIIGTMTTKTKKNTNDTLPQAKTLLDAMATTNENDSLPAAKTNANNTATMQRKRVMTITIDNPPTTSLAPAAVGTMRQTPVPAHPLLLAATTMNDNANASADYSRPPTPPQLMAPKAKEERCDAALAMALIATALPKEDDDSDDDEGGGGKN